MPKKNNVSIPLICSLCPKTPQFSDVSHLLTHISSKSHLSHRFKLQIRSQSELDARQKLEEFEVWYAENGLEDLLSERMAAKEQKKNTSKRSRSSTGKINTAANKGESQFSIRKPIEVEDNPHSMSASASGFQAPVPRMHTWSTAPLSLPLGPQSAFSDSHENSIYSTPTSKRSLPNFSKDSDSISRRTRGAL